MEFHPITGFSQSFINSIKSPVWMHFTHFPLIRQALNQLESRTGSRAQQQHLSAGFYRLGIVEILPYGDASKPLYSKQHYFYIKCMSLLNKSYFNMCISDVLKPSLMLVKPTADQFKQTNKKISQQCCSIQNLLHCSGSFWSNDQKSESIIMKVLTRHSFTFSHRLRHSIPDLYLQIHFDWYFTANIAVIRRDGQEIQST